MEPTSESQAGGRRVLAIALDAMEISLVDSMIKDGRLPTLKRLRESGSWSRVTSPNDVSTGAVWPNFTTGRRECDHGHYAIWNWDPVDMRLAYADTRRLAPFWRRLDENGYTVGVLDVPFSPFLELRKGFEVHEWGSHSPVEGRVQISPGTVANEVRTAFPAHPFSDPLARTPQEPAEIPRFLDQALDGLRVRGDLAHHLVTQVRPDLAIVVFEEAHHAGHFLWHTIEPDLAMYADLPPVVPPEKTLADLYQEMDRQVGRLVDAAGPETSVFVFALHGMGPARGIPAVLDALLPAMGLASIAPQGRRSVLAELKSRMPEPIRNLYRRSVPLSRRSQWGRSAVLPDYDWTQTRAFALPMEQYGLVRINLAGRETHGIVSPDEFEKTCDAIERALRELSTVDGRPVVKDVLRPPRGAHPAGLPDLVVHWTDASFEVPALVHGAEVINIQREQTGEHTPDGFCLVTGPAAASSIPGTIEGTELHQILLAALR
jgi:predicted AlkP superfamily phosphohydrolase/phosphomutase